MFCFSWSCFGLIPRTSPALCSYWTGYYHRCSSLWPYFVVFDFKCTCIYNHASTWRTLFAAQSMWRTVASVPFKRSLHDSSLSQVPTRKYIKLSKHHWNNRGCSVHTSVQCINSYSNILLLELGAEEWRSDWVRTNNAKSRITHYQTIWNLHRWKGFLRVHRKPHLSSNRCTKNLGGEYRWEDKRLKPKQKVSFQLTES